MREVRRRLHSGEPLDLLAEASTLLTLVDRREYGFGRRDGEPPYSLSQLVETSSTSIASRPRRCSRRSPS